MCPPAPESRTPAAKQIARIAVERRKAKRLVTTVRGLVDEGSHLSDVLTLLKNSCGAGGSIQEGVVELQGDQREKAAATLSAKGYRVKQ
ncbi:translation initiation factor [Planctomicrobium piriforme]|uniref:Translation initiation factor 1 n=1 Tax=Planctomicrobium piriforme TaxID=1576369 RepID=A0A1I3S892_9PLAN|nr:translation initiation factor [Planctomicrobium piriforme]SFJ53777.1 translation initiation factor 1 [Planctomicrobium piriforme]